jgi:4a-hydroxytetrahydrobiopterin dehydratase
MSSSDLAAKHCIPCHGGVPPLEEDERSRLLAELGNDWEAVDGHHLHKTYTFPDFVAALAFTNRMGVIAEREGHHPEILLAWGKVELTVWTHAIDGLTEGDFVLAAKADEALGEAA